MTAIRSPEEVLTFWFGDGTPKLARWFGKDDAFDREIRERFGETLEAAAHGALDTWAATPKGRLALVLVLDQFSRNVFRDTPRMFEHDAKALKLVREGMARGDDVNFTPLESGFFYLPLEHSEDLATQEESVRRFLALNERAPGALRKITASFHDYAVKHRDIIARFGRFPHRNAILGRRSTAEEQAFLEEPGSSF